MWGSVLACYNFMREVLIVLDIWNRSAQVIQILEPSTVPCSLGFIVLALVFRFSMIGKMCFSLQVESSCWKLRLWECGNLHQVESGTLATWLQLWFGCKTFGSETLLERRKLAVAR